jgi:hypothetical protein
LVVLPSGQKHIWVNVVKGADLSDAKSIIWVEGHLETCCSSLNGNDEKQKDLESIFFFNRHSSESAKSLGPY